MELRGKGERMNEGKNGGQRWARTCSECRFCYSKLIWIQKFAENSSEVFISAV